MLCLYSKAQQTLKVMVHEADSRESLPGVTVRIKGHKIGGHTDLKGYLELKDIPDGRQTILFDLLGYRQDSLILQFPLLKDSLFHISLNEGLEINEVVISSSARNGNRVEDQPLKIEVLGTEEVDEKTAMKPANISMMLTEYTGVQAQRTSVTSGNISVKIHGLDGRYTQILKDGFPLYSGMAGGLSLMQTPPLDLKQAEIIKGSASTLYGGDAIGGVINLISREPDTVGGFSAILNQTSRKETDIISFYQKRTGKLGFTFLTNASRQNPIDINGDGFTDLPQSQLYTVSPKIFYFFNDSTKLTAGLSFGYDNRAGGYINAVSDPGADTSRGYVQRNISNRSFSELKFEKKYTHGNYLTLKNSFGYFERALSYSGSLFSGKQLSSYTEASYLRKFTRNDLVIGANLLTDNFTRDNDTAIRQSYQYYTIGAFIQDNWQINSVLNSQAGFRYDHHNRYGYFYLPQVALLLHINKQLYARASYGLGYKIPTIFSVQSETEGFQDFSAINPEVKAERSEGTNVDLTYKGSGDDISFAVTQSAFYNAIHSPVVPVFDASGNFSYRNAAADITTKGLETNFNAYFLRNFNFAMGYTYTVASRLYDNAAPVLPLTSRHSLMLDLLYNDHKWKFGAEAYYLSRQYLSDGSTRPDYWLAGFLAARNIKNFVLTLNFENLLNVKQTSYESIYTGSLQHPVFKELWAPLDGFVANASIRINL